MTNGVAGSGDKATPVQSRVESGVVYHCIFTAVSKRVPVRLYSARSASIPGVVLGTRGTRATQASSHGLALHKRRAGQGIVSERGFREGEATKAPTSFPGIAWLPQCDGQCHATHARLKRRGGGAKKRTKRLDVRMMARALGQHHQHHQHTSVADEAHQEPHLPPSGH